MSQQRSLACEDRQQHHLAVSLPWTGQAEQSTLHEPERLQSWLTAKQLQATANIAQRRRLCQRMLLEDVEEQAAHQRRPGLQCKATSLPVWRAACAGKPPLMSAPAAVTQKTGATQDHQVSGGGLQKLTLSRTTSTAPVSYTSLWLLPCGRSSAADWSCNVLASSSRETYFNACRPLGTLSTRMERLQGQAHHL